jgi:LemA protein
MIWVGLAFGGLVAWALVIYNRLVALRVRASNSWADIDVQLKRRFDLVPNLVAAVQGYAAHEKAVFEDVAKLRAQAAQSPGPADREAPESGLSSAIKTLFAIAENYPDLRADQNFRQLQTQLAEIENNIQHARRYYNAVVRDMNTAVQTVPSNLIAALFGFRRLDYFQAGDAEREPVSVDMGDKP